MVRPECARIAELRRLIADLEARLPAHSAPPSMIRQLEDLEEELKELERAATAD